METIFYRCQTRSPWGKWDEKKGFTTMQQFTVTKPQGTKEQEFQAYTSLLDDLGIDVANVPRVPEPATQRRWLYVWNRRDHAEAFSRELQRRTGDPSWYVHAFEQADQFQGPVAPLDIFQSLDNTTDDQYHLLFFVAPKSQERILSEFPHTELSPSIPCSPSALKQFKEREKDQWYQKLAERLTGLTQSQIMLLGGFRLVMPNGEIEHEEFPAISVPA